MEIPTGGKYTLPTIEEIGFTAPEGKEFDKWEVYLYGVIPNVYDHSDARYDQGEDLTIPPTSTPMTVKATWKDKYYTVSFVMNGAKGQAPAQSIKHGDTVTKPYTYPHLKKVL